MKLIICGSRTLTNESQVKNLIDKGISELKIKNRISEIVSGGAKGPDLIGEIWAKENNIQVKKFIPDWSIGKRAGILRNIEMCEYSTGGYLICIHDGVSKGALQCYNYGTQNGLTCVKYEIK